jgi:hypothetical protein
MASGRGATPVLAIPCHIRFTIGIDYAVAFETHHPTSVSGSADIV